MRITPMIIATLLSVTPVYAQISVAPTAGFLKTDRAVNMISDTHRAELPGATIIGVSLETATPISTLHFRAAFATTYGADLSSRPAVLFGPCDMCSDSFTPQIGTASIQNFAASAVWRPNLDWAVRPHFLAGGGLKRLETSRYVDGEAQLRHVHSSTRPAIHAGAGLGVKVGFASLEFEAIDYLSGFWGDDVSARTSGDLAENAMNRNRHDLALGASIRIPLW
jgi:hypothetical protein